MLIGPPPSPPRLNSFESASSDSDSSPKSRRCSYSLKTKKDFIQKAERLREEQPSLSVRAICAAEGLPNSYYSRWKKDIAKAEELATDLENKCNITQDTRQLHQGRVGVLEPWAEDLHKVFRLLRDKGIPVSSTRMHIEAKKISDDFRKKSLKAKKAIISRLAKRLGLSHRGPTHIAQKHYKETMLLAKHFLFKMQERLSGKNKHKIANVDQTPITFAPAHNSTLQEKGSKTVHVMSVGDKMRCTVNVGCTMGGSILTPHIIFKGQPGGRIEKREFPSYPSGAYYGINKNAWCDTIEMERFIRTSLKDWIVAGYQWSQEVPVLVLDSYAVHQMTSTIRLIENLGCDVIIIPGGCTYLCQPVDVGLNRPLKKEMTNQWESWVESTGDDLNAPSRCLVAEWIIGALNSLTTQTVMNAWRKRGFQWEV